MGELNRHITAMVLNQYIIYFRIDDDVYCAWCTHKDCLLNNCVLETWDRRTKTWCGQIVKFDSVCAAIECASEVTRSTDEAMRWTHE